MAIFVYVLLVIIVWLVIENISQKEMEKIIIDYMKDCLQINKSIIETQEEQLKTKDEIIRCNEKINQSQEKQINLLRKITQL